MRRTLAVAAAVTLAALAAPGAALAHASLERATPATQSSVRVPPTTITLRFNSAVTATQDAIRVLAPNGRSLSGVARVSADRREVTARVFGLKRGMAYTVRWRVTGSDGHSPGGVFTFGVGVKPPPPTEAVGAGGATWRDDLARWLLFGALALLIGPLAVRQLVLFGPLPAELERRFHLVTTVAAFAVIDIGIAAFVLRASNALQLPAVDLLYGDLEPFAEKTRFGVAFLVMTFGFAIVAGLLLVAWVFDRLELRWLALVLSVVLVTGMSLSGHQGTEPNSTPFSELADWVHLVAASIWVGGVATLALLVWPSAAPALRRRAFLGFSRLAVVLVAAMVLGGAYLALVRLPALSDLWQTDYGQVLLFKLVVVGLALSWGGVHHLFVRPRLEAGEQPRAGLSLVGESVAALVVLLAAAILTNASPPPPKEPSSSAAVLTNG
jgi:copper transport protein